MNSGVSNAIAMLQDRIDGGMTVEQAMDELLQVLENDLQVLDDDRAARSESLQKQGRPQADINARLKAFDLQYDFIVNIADGVRLLRFQKWKPNA